MISSQIRALQHLLVQDFTLYTAEAYAALQSVGSQTILDPAHMHAVVNSDATVLCKMSGAELLLPLDVTSVREARVRIEGAVAVGKTPSADKLETFSEEMLLQEMQRRGLTVAREP